MTYDATNIFAKILRREIAVDIIYEDAFALAFYDIKSQAKIHALVIPKGSFAHASHFFAQASSEEMVGFFRATSQVIEKLGINHGGFRLITNEGIFGGQEVPHFHVHLLGGTTLGPLVCPPS